MRFIILKYKKEPLDRNDTGKSIGVLVQQGKQVLFRFASKQDLDKLGKYDQNFDEFIVGNIGKTIQSVIDQKVVYASIPKLEVGAKTSTSDVEFLEHLKGSYQGKVQFSDIKEANYPDAKKGLNYLFRQYVSL